MTARTGIAGAQVARRIVVNSGSSIDFGDLSLPWPLRSMRRNQHPLAEERIISAVRAFRPFCRNHRQDDRIQTTSHATADEETMAEMALLA